MINPNSDASLTSYLREVALRVLPQGSEVEALTCANSPRVIETSTDDVLASVEVLRATMATSNQDAFFVACFGDPAIMSLREVTQAPVVGLGTAALVQARLVTSRFGLLTTLERGVPSLWSQLESAGAGAACVGIRAVHSQAVQGSAAPDDDLMEDRLPALAERLEERARELLAAGAAGIILACAGFSPMSAALGAALNVPVCDGVAFGACIAHGLWASGVWTSKAGAYAWSDAAWAKPNPS